ncbi:MAG: DNA polymerase IV [Bacteroidales bacterium]|jgi:DNA polymerase-4|nr:DNA polymerase IV [Bacteroidales bacterium]MDI9593024.1 DNA polymerase IV [Bacteroidota bacterium]OQC36234.1 MAG: DNA polymerase IV [Bacteroidetes bacterium ADurb.Bin041]MBP7874419.1 DNA polymerase IV [Bacteroidales bacterium]MCO6468913.1 DNA polymerase IV [Bacteroidales bacterium]
MSNWQQYETQPILELNNDELNDRRTVVHFDLDTFFVSVERLLNSSLTGKPVIVGGVSDRSVVAGCSYEARRFGVHSAMPMKLALNLCRDAIVIRGDMEQYTKYSRMVTEIIAESAPIYEKASIDEHYLDITGMDRFFGSMKWTHELRQRIIKETGLPISVGLSVNKTVSKIATGEAKPNGELQVILPHVKPFLAPLSIRKIPMIGLKTYQTLRSMGIINIQTLSMIPPEMMKKLMGKNGIDIWKKANGIDTTPVTPYSEQKSISTETTFDQDTIDVTRMHEILIAMIEKIAFNMRKKGKLTGCITVKIRYSNFDTHTLQKTISYTSFDHILTKTAIELFDRLYTRRMLIRLIGVRFSHLVNGVQQLSMFENTPEMINLYQTLDRIRKRFGEKAIFKATAL